MRTLAGLAAAVAVAATSAASVPGASVSYLVGRQQPDGGFAEPGGRSDPALTAWVVLGLRAAGRDPALLERSPEDYLAGKPYASASDLALRVLALRALGASAVGLAGELEKLRQADGRIGPLVNSTVWGVLALRAAGRPAGAATVEYLLSVQGRSGGWSWSPRGTPDSNDTAAAVQALRAAGVGPRSRAIRRALAYLRRLQDRDGGFELTPGRGSDTQSTAWAIQAFLAAGVSPGRAAHAFLARMRRADGSFRYSARHAITPVWVTAQAVVALAGKPFPLR